MIITICGKKRVGKTTMAESFIRALKDKGIEARYYAFANELKRELDPLFLLNAGVSAFTEDPVEKELLRPSFIAYGTGYWRNKDPDHWIKRVDEKIKSANKPHVALVGDGRFPNEVNWTKQSGGETIYLGRYKSNGEEYPPAGKDEEENDPLLKSLADHKYFWEDCRDNLETCYYKADQLLTNLFSDKFQTWTKTFPLYSK